VARGREEGVGLAKRFEVAACAADEIVGGAFPPPVANPDDLGGGILLESISSTLARLYAGSPVFNDEATSAKTGSSSKILRALANASEEGGGMKVFRPVTNPTKVVLGVGTAGTKEGAQSDD
jgi:hypothetical protein